MNENFSTLAEAINSGIKVPIVPQGESMKPLLNGKSDKVILVKPERKPKKGDLLLYRDHIGRLVVHRVHKIDKKNKLIYMLGDSNIKIEPPIIQSDVLGVAGSICRKGKTFSVKNPIYRLYAWVWSYIIRYRKAVLYNLINEEYGFR